MRLGYNTNGLAHHRLLDAVDLVADIGYRSVAITVDHHALDPEAPDGETQLDRLRAKLAMRGLHSVIETGARFLLDPWQKHQPTMISPEGGQRQRRVEFLKRAIDYAAALGSDCVSLWSGTATDDAPREVLWQRLIGSLHVVLDYASARGVVVGFEPEPGMLVATLHDFDFLASCIDHPNLRLTIDVGHLYCQREDPIDEAIERHGDRLVNVHIEDMRRDVHEHLMFGEGEMDFPPIVEALRRVGYQGGVHVELSRHSHEGPAAARRAYAFLAPLFTRAEKR